jgi:flagellar hook assembly protein FlgD
VKIYNSAGELVRVLWSQPIRTSLANDFGWDGKNEAGKNVASGIYVIYYTNRYQTQMAKLLVIR